MKTKVNHQCPPKVAVQSKPFFQKITEPKFFSPSPDSNATFFNPSPELSLQSKNETPSGSPAPIQLNNEGNHNLKSERFAGDEVLEKVYDNEALVANGHHGTYVQKLQQALIDAGHALAQYGADGIFGSETQQVVKNYQTSKGLIVDGVIGFGTLGEMDKQFANQSKPPPITPNICTDYTNNSILNHTVQLTSRGDNDNQSEDANILDEYCGDQPAKPLAKKDCNTECGNPPLDKKGPPGLKKNDIVSPKAGATFAIDGTNNCECALTGDVLRVLSEPFSGGTDANGHQLMWVKVRICNAGGQIQDKLIQHRFLNKEGYLSPKITGPEEVRVGEKITLKVEGVPRLLNPEWVASQPDGKKIKMKKKDNDFSLDIHGIKKSVKREITIAVKVCDEWDTKQITILSKNKDLKDIIGRLKRITRTIKTKNQRKRLECLLDMVMDPKKSDHYINGKDSNVKLLARGKFPKMSNEDFVKYVLKEKVRRDLTDPIFTPKDDNLVKENLKSLDLRILSGINLINHQLDKNSHLNFKNPILEQMHEYVSIQQKNPESVYYCYGSGQ
ncbi:MAG: peptidoglycan-binding domain-containing protein [Bacteroidota bacterium]